MPFIGFEKKDYPMTNILKQKLDIIIGLTLTLITWVLLCGFSLGPGNNIDVDPLVDVDDVNSIDTNTEWILTSKYQDNQSNQFDEIYTYQYSDDGKTVAEKHVTTHPDEPVWTEAIT